LQTEKHAIEIGICVYQVGFVGGQFSNAKKEEKESLCSM
jgi:hypothetical protein